LQPDQRSAFQAVRDREFPDLEGIHFNSASYAPVPARALAAAREFEARRAAAALHPADFGPVLDRARAAAARLVNAAAAEIALVPNTSVGLNQAAAIARQRAVRRGAAAPRTIILPDGEFPANVYCWMALERDGFRVERLPLDALGYPPEDLLLERVGQGDVAVLAISAVQFATGYMADLRRLGAACRDAGVLFVVDGIQAVGVTPVDVTGAGVDILASGGHKWLCGPFGTGFMYIRHELCLEHEPDFPGWLAFESSTDFERLVSYEWDLFSDARRFEVGSLPIQSFVALAESMELLLELGVSSIRDHVHALHQPLLEWARRSSDVAAVVTEPTRTAGILSVRVPDAAALHHWLMKDGISTVTREGAVRFSPHCFNTVDEVARVLDSLHSFRG
jgi:cysteine desulfurase / selenocysteine lyase